MNDLETSVNLFLVAHKRAIDLVDAEAALPPRLMGEMRQRRLRPQVDAFLEAYRQAIASASQALGSPVLARLTEEAYRLTASITAREAQDLLVPLKMWLETSDV